MIFDTPPAKKPKLFTSAFCIAQNNTTQKFYATPSATDNKLKSEQEQTIQAISEEDPFTKNCRVIYIFFKTVPRTKTTSSPISTQSVQGRILR